MASIHKRTGKPFYYAAYLGADGRRKLVSTKTDNRHQAIQTCNALERAARKARHQELNPATAREVIERAVADMMELSGQTLPHATTRAFLESWLEEKKESGAEQTYAEYKGVVTRFLEFLGARANQSLATLGAADVKNYRAQVAARVSAATTNKHLKILRTAFGRAVKEEYIRQNPAALVDKLKVTDSQKRRPFSMAEIRKILGSADPEWKTMVLLGLYCGLRLSDCAHLTWQNVDLMGKELTVETQKTGRVVILPIAKPLLNHVETLAGDDPKAYLSPRLAKLRTSQLSAGFYDLLVSVGLAKARVDHRGRGKGRNTKRTGGGLSFHCLRHTATSLLKNAGVSEAITMDIIGHESEAISRHYTHIDSATKREAVAKLPDVTKPVKGGGE